MGNSKGMVTRLKIQTIDAAKQTTYIMNRVEIYKRIFINEEPTIYMISDHGTVINTKRHRKLTPHIREDRGHKILEDTEPWNRYIDYALCHNGKYHYLQAHRLVALYFLPIPLKYIKKGFTVNDLQVDHIDNNKSNNDISNLQWMTQKENSDKVRISNRDRYVSGVLHPMCKISESQLLSVGKLLEENKLTMRQISDFTGVPYNTIKEIKAGRRFKYLSRLYNIKGYNMLNTNKVQLERVKKLLDLAINGDITMLDMSRLTGLSYSTVKDILHKRTWRWLSDSYDLSKYN